MILLGEYALLALVDVGQRYGSGHVTILHLYIFVRIQVQKVTWRDTYLADVYLRLLNIEGL